MEVLERQILQLTLDPVDPQTVGQRRIDIEGFLGDLDLFFNREMVQGSHVVGAVSELDQDDADIPGHRKDHLPEVLCLFLLAASEIDLAEFGHPIDQGGDLIAKDAPHLVHGRQGVFHRIVEEAPHDARDIQLQLGNDVGDGQGMNEVRLSRKALLPGVDSRREIVGPADQVEVGRGVIGLDLLN